ncbi:hypothetical protein [Rickettsia endosymbiont of Polydrusus tereticollis]|uniref:hypothetical protein n=1 Tax=Rickettsia endosymbiont of Polydrusus tereticollis TaxID=3066251 RepID=UPI00313302D8
MQRIPYNYFINLSILIFTVFSFSPSKAVISKEIRKQEPPGYQVQFDYQNYSKEREIAKQYFDKVYNDSSVFANINVKYVGIDLFDINDDGKKEIFAYINYGDKCPLAGCPFVILKQTKNHKYIKIPWDEHSVLDMHCNAKIKILAARNLNYNNLLFYNRDGSPAAIWEWKGSYYNIKQNF